MRISPSVIQPLAREHGKPTAGRGHATTNAAIGAGTPAPTDAASQASNPAPSAKTPPPGLERVLARMQSVPESERNAGQTKAFDRISRNLDRYRETQALVQAPPAAPPPSAPGTAPGTLDSSSATESVNAADATASSTSAPVEAPVASTVADPTDTSSTSA